MGRPGAVAYLYDRGGHYVLCHGKRPIWSRWQRRRPGLDTVLAHAGPLGIVPWSLGTSALDVDDGDVGELIVATAPLVTLQSPRGKHCYYEDHRGRGNKRWQRFGCRGEVRSARGFLRLYEGGADRLASALRTTPAGSTAFPADLFDAAGVDLPRTLPVERARAFKVRVPDDLPALETVREGGRNVALFDHVRFWAYVQDKGVNLDSWSARVRRIAAQCNARFPDPLPDDEVRRLAWSIASWTWAGGGPVDHSPAAQRRRGLKSGKVRRAKVADRDAAILEDRTAGMTMRAIAHKHRVGKSTVHRVLSREPNHGGGVLSVSSAVRGKGRPRGTGEREGISMTVTEAIEGVEGGVRALCAMVEGGGVGHSTVPTAMANLRRDMAALEAAVYRERFNLEHADP